MKLQKNSVSVINIKLDRATRDKFKQLTSDLLHLTMQEFIYAFIHSYVNNPNSFSINTNIEQIEIEPDAVKDINKIEELKQDTPNCDEADFGDLRKYI